MSSKTAHKLMAHKDGSNATIWNAFPDSTIDLWDQNILIEYVIPYELDSRLHYTLQNMLPKVNVDP